MDTTILSMNLFIIISLAVLIIISGYIVTQIKNLQVYDKANENQLKNLATDIRANNRVIAKNNPNIILEN